MRAARTCYLILMPESTAVRGLYRYEFIVLDVEFYFRYRWILSKLISATLLSVKNK